MITEGANESSLRKQAENQGMSSLAQEAVAHAIAGNTTIAEVVRITGEEEGEE
jgi:type II secretory ATPase GspE/PulE/Tfp pilus assembly ATPase PilB-like protein